MTRIVIYGGAFALVLSSGIASAADLPSRKTPTMAPPAPAPLWTGFYVGVNAGGAFGSSTTNIVEAPFWSDPISLAEAVVHSSSAKTNYGGFIGGGQFGYNWQFNSVFIAGLETDIQGLASFRGTVSEAIVGSGAITSVPAAVPVTIAKPFTAPFTVAGFPSTTKSLDYLGTLRGRIGFLAVPNLLVYGTGGLAYGGANFTASIAGVTSATVLGNLFQGLTIGSASFSDTRVGWAAGGGAEWLFLSNWSAKVEYLYYDLGSVTVSSPTIFAGTTFNAAFISGIANASTRFDGHVVRAGLNYHFDLGANPSIAKF